MTTPTNERDALIEDAKAALLAEFPFLETEEEINFSNEDINFYKRLVELQAARAKPLEEQKQEPSKQTPYANCQFQICDLPGQCRGDGRCHHPVTVADIREAPLTQVQKPIGTVYLDEYQMKQIRWNAHHWTHILSSGDKLYLHPSSTTALVARNEALEATEKMKDGARSFLLGLELGFKTFDDMNAHLRLCGAYIPQWFADGKGHLNKMAKAHYIYDAMLAASPKKEGN